MEDSHSYPNTPRGDYQAAEWQITRAIADGAVKLSLVGLSLLEKLPRKIEEFSQLQYLSIKWCHNVDDLTPLRNLSQLQLLCLDKCYSVRDLTPLKSLAKLQQLVLRDCRGVSDLDPLKNLVQLQHLVLRYCGAVSDLAPLENLTQLQHLVIDGCFSVCDLAPLKNLTQLQHFALDGCYSISDLAPLKNLAQLRHLVLRNCGIVRDLAPLAAIPHLAELDLRNLTFAPPFEPLKLLLPTLSGLYLHDSKFPDLGSDLCQVNEYWDDEKSNVLHRVRAHYTALEEQGVRKDDEVKVIVLGNGRVGKTSLVKALMGEDHDEQEVSTHGIKLWTMELSFQAIDGDGEKTEVAQLNVWDFAGQDLYHQTHRLFLQARAVYLILWAEEELPEDPEEGEMDVRRSLRYWLEQLGSLKQGGEMPHVLVVRNRCDLERKEVKRKDWRHEVPEEYRDLREVACSAATRESVEEVREWLSKAVAETLGGKQKRVVGAGRAAVKEVLREWQKENEKAHREAEEKRRRHEPPHALMTREEFRELVREKCAGSGDAEEPDEVLGWLHRQGVLYWNERLTPEQVILDQRWAIEGIYSLFHRKRCVTKLWRQQGRFTASQLGDWLWNEEGYAKAEQEVFLNFMLACGIAYRVLEDTESVRGEAVYIAPAALSTRAEMEVEMREMLKAAGHDVNTPTHRLETAPGAERHLSAEPILQFMCRIGRRWKRAARLWRYGALFQSRQDGSWVLVDWVKVHEGDFGGKLRVELYGKDNSFFVAVIDELVSSPGFPKETAHGLKSQLDKSSPLGKSLYPYFWNRIGSAHGSHPLIWEGDNSLFYLGKKFLKKGQDWLESHEPVAEEKVKPRVGLSYKSDEGDAMEIEKHPQALLKALRDRSVPVMEFRSNQDPSMYAFHLELVKQDILVAFVSRGYLHSGFCMWELMKVYEREPVGAFAEGQCHFVWFKGARPERRPAEHHEPGTLYRHALEGYWREKVAEENKLLSDSIDGRPLQLLEKKTEYDVEREWLTFIHNEANRRLFFDTLLDQRRGDEVEAGATGTKMDEWCDAVCDKLTTMLDRPENLLEAVRMAWRGPKRDKVRARELLLCYLRLGPGAEKRNNEELLKGASFEGDEEMEGICAQLLWDEMRSDRAKG